MEDLFNSKKSSYDIEKAVAWLNSKGLDSSIHKCAQYVREAIEAGGLSTEGRPNSAKDYDWFLPMLGFATVPKEGYAPKKGDVVVLQNTSTSSEHGHIAMYNGTQWISDFKQSDFWGGSAYRNKAEHTFFRYI